jgi:hypothetical protein
VGRDRPPPRASSSFQRLADEIDHRSIYARLSTSDGRYPNQAT